MSGQLMVCGLLLPSLPQLPLLLTMGLGTVTPAITVSLHHLPLLCPLTAVPPLSPTMVSGLPLPHLAAGSCCCPWGVQPWPGGSLAWSAAHGPSVVSWLWCSLFPLVNWAIHALQCTFLPQQ